MQRAVLRLIDANCNRAMEGLRVCEDIMRFIIDNKPLTASFKNARHMLIKNMKTLPVELSKIIRQRDVKKDVGKKTNISEIERRDYKDIFYVNLQRVKESVRVLEEFSKLIEPARSENFKRMRYLVYTLEKKAINKL